MPLHSHADATASDRPARTILFKIGAPDTLWNSVYVDKALGALRKVGYPLAEEDVARLSPFGRRHINVIGTYTFALPDLGPGGVRGLRNPDEPEWDD
jgi:hypothetical protein